MEGIKKAFEEEMKEELFPRSLAAAALLQMMRKGIFE